MVYFPVLVNDTLTPDILPLAVIAIDDELPLPLIGPLVVDMFPSVVDIFPDEVMVPLVEMCPTVVIVSVCCRVAIR